MFSVKMVTLKLRDNIFTISQPHRYVLSVYYTVFTDISRQSEKSKVLSSSYFNDIIKVASAHVLVVNDVPRDGNCAIHAVLDQLQLLSNPGLLNHSVADLRSRAVEFLQQNHLQLEVGQYLVKRDYSDIATYIRQQSKSGVWIDEPMMQAMSEVIQRDIEIYHDNGHLTIVAPIINMSDGKALKVCHLYCLGRF